MIAFIIVYIVIFFMIIGIVGLFLLSDIKIELKYRNTLLEKQNDKRTTN